MTMLRWLYVAIQSNANFGFASFGWTKFNGLAEVTLLSSGIFVWIKWNKLSTITKMVLNGKFDTLSYTARSKIPLKQKRHRPVVANGVSIT